MKKKERERESDEVDQICTVSTVGVEGRVDSARARRQILVCPVLTSECHLFFGVEQETKKGPLTKKKGKAVKSVLEPSGLCSCPFRYFYFFQFFVVPQPMNELCMI